MGLSSETQAKIDKALADGAAETEAKTVHESALAALQAATTEEATDKAAVQQAHQAAQASGKEAVSALAAELGVEVTALLARSLQAPK